MLWAEQVEHHVTHQCSLRTVSCDDCGLKDICVRDKATHAAKECPKRMVACSQGCGARMRYDVFAYVHIKFDCPKSLVPCPRGKYRLF